MANVKINSLPSNKHQVVESITEAKQLVPKDSGKYFMFDQGAYNITLPKLSENIAGWNCTIIKRTSNDTGDTTLTTYSGDGAKTFYIEVEGNDASVATPVTNILFKDTNSYSTDPHLFAKIWTDGSNWYTLLLAKSSGAFTAS